MALAITLEYDGVEQSLADWGISLDSVTLAERNLAASVLSFVRLGDTISTAATFAYRGKVILRVNREGSGTTWADGAGARVDFIGYRLLHLVQSSGENFGVQYQFANAWHFLEQTPYVQFFVSRDTDGEVLFTKQVPELLLFQRLDGSNAIEARNSGEQIEDILQFVLDAFAAQSMAQPFIIGDIDPALVLPSYQTRQLMCEDAILKCVELSPDVNVWFDYSTDVSGEPTPTIHFLSRGSQTAVELALHNGTDHKSLAIMARPDLKPRSVVVTYKITGSDSGALWIQYLTDKYGPNGQSHASDPDYGLDVLTQFIDLQGSQRTAFNTAAVNATHATDATRIAWWQEKSPKLKSDKISGITIPTGSVTVKDGSGSAVSLTTYPNEVIGGIASDAVGVKFVTITAKVSYNLYATSTAATAATASLATVKKVDEEISIRIQVTDSVSNSIEVIGGETVPGLVEIVDGVGTFSNGLAKQIWDTLNRDQIEGEDVRVADVPSGAVTFANKLNLTGGLAAWATMAAQIQSITRHYGTGEVSVSFGPPKHNNADALNQLIQWSRPRFVWFNPALRSSGKAASNSGDTSKENTDHGSGTEKVSGAVYEY